MNASWSHLDGAVRVVETAASVELWLSDPVTGRWTVRTVHARDGLVGPPSDRTTAPDVVGPSDRPASDADPVVGPPSGPAGRPVGRAAGFDFLAGTWRTRHRRLRERLTGCTDWDEFDTTMVARTLLGGLVSVDEAAIPRPTPYRGMTFRTYDVAAGEWRLHWFDSRDLRMDPAPVRGRFAADGVGTFLTRDVQEGVPVLVRFHWTVPAPDSATWEQAFSTDDGATWEVNWTMTHERIA